MTIVILPSARDDLAAGFAFYEQKEQGLGTYFFDSLFRDIDGLKLHAGVHRRVFGYHRLLSKKFPYAVYYSFAQDTVFVRGVLDCRQDPTAIRRRLMQAL